MPASRRGFVRKAVTYESMTNAGRCGRCGGSLRARRKDARYCSATCRVLAHRSLKDQAAMDATERLALAMSLLDRKQIAEFDRRLSRRRGRREGASIG